MGYTREHLIDAYCRSKEFVATEEMTNEQFFQSEITAEVVRIRENAVQQVKDRVKSRALDQLRMEAEESAEDL